MAPPPRTRNKRPLFKFLNLPIDLTVRLPHFSFSSSSTAAAAAALRRQFVQSGQMGFLFYAIKVPKVLTISFFLNLISHAHYLFIAALTHLRLYKQPPPEESPDSAASPENYILILDSSSPSLVPIPVRVVTAAIKKRVPVIEYQEFLRREEAAAVEEQSEKVCSICLECIEGRHEIRELCNCRHLFHRECLDTWIDEGQVSCPLCRSMLLPPRVNLFRCNQNPVA